MLPDVEFFQFKDLKKLTRSKIRKPQGSISALQEKEAGRELAKVRECNAYTCTGFMKHLSEEASLTLRVTEKI